METSERTEQLLQCLVHVIGRAALPLEKVQGIVGSGRKQIEAFNLLDGCRTLTEVAKKAKLDTGNLSRSVARWVENGIVFRVGDGKDACALHIYPIPSPSPRRGKTAGKRRK